MKRLYFCLLLCLLAVGIFVFSFYTENTHTEYLRIHIRANSNSEEDQAVKYKVKEEIVSFLTPYLSDCKTKRQAEKVLREKEKEIEKVADGVLFSYKFNYKSDAEIKNEKFPTRTYNSLTLKSGYYDALIVNLGDGDGDNWWCVVYPPLCFVGNGENITYKSKLLEIIDDFLRRRGTK
ncbi:MAG: stage II sporulation protein R [Clostridia bacterium]|nr:stage II sporulation protein R [Clostridia bacterium]